MSVALTGSAFITERKEGMMQRTQVAGVTTGEIITAHLMTQYVIMAGQTMLVLAVMIWVFHVEIEGSVTAAVVLTLVQGTCGMAYGKYNHIAFTKSNFIVICKAISRESNYLRLINRILNLMYLY